MAKKKRNRIWWFAMSAADYKKLKIARKLTEPTVMFDKEHAAYAQAFANRFIPKVDEQGNRVVVDDYAQLVDTGKIVVMGIRGEAINWSKKVPSERPGEGLGEVIVCDQHIDLTDKVVYKVMEESDDQYYRHLKSPLARAGGITIPTDLAERIAKKKAEQAEAGANSNEQQAEDEVSPTAEDH